MKKKQKDRKIYVIIALIIVILTLSVAYSAMMTTLKITGSATMETASWQVGFVEGTVNGEASGTSLDGIICGQASVTAAQVNVEDVTLSKPDDTCIYPLQIQNTGTIRATLNAITAIPPKNCEGGENPAEMQCGNVNYRLVHTDGDLLTANSPRMRLEAEIGMIDIQLIVKYLGSDLNTVAVTQTGAGFTLNYQQTD